MAYAKKTKKSVTKSKTKANTFDVRKKAFLNWLKKPANFFIFVIIVAVVLFIGNFLLDRTIGYFERKNVENKYADMKQQILDGTKQFEVSDVEENANCRYTSRKYDKGELYCYKNISIKITPSASMDDPRSVVSSLEQSFGYDFTEKEIDELFENRSNYLVIRTPEINKDCGFVVYYESSDGFSIGGSCSDKNPQYEYFPVE